MSRSLGDEERGDETMGCIPTETAEGLTELLELVCEEADASRAADLVLAETHPVLRWVEPALEDTIRVLAVVSLAAGSTLAKLLARDATVRVAARVAASRVLAEVHEVALGPVLGVGAGARLHLEAVHAELVGVEEPALEVHYTH
jgi:hypothetical protein